MRIHVKGHALDLALKSGVFQLNAVLGFSQSGMRCSIHFIRSVDKQPSHCKHDAGGLERQITEADPFSNILTRYGRLKHVEDVRAEEESGAPPRSFSLSVDSFYQSAWPDLPSRRYFFLCVGALRAEYEACMPSSAGLRNLRFPRGYFWIGSSYGSDKVARVVADDVLQCNVTAGWAADDVQQAVVSHSECVQHKYCTTRIVAARNSSSR